jgi:ATP-dependent protease ClpP protease subunit
MRHFKEVSMLAIILALAVAIPGFSLVYPDTTPIPDPVTLTVSRSKAIIVQGALNYQMEGMATTDLAEVHYRMLKLVEAKETLIDVIIDSGGGAFTPASEALFAYMDYLKARRIIVRCTIDGMAASLAAIFLSHCGERYAAGNSFVMVHGARANTGRGMNTHEAQKLSDELDQMDNEVWHAMMVLFNDSAYWDKNFDAERQIPVAELALQCPNVVVIIDHVEIIE